MNKITINGKEYSIHYTIRALFIWEQITGKPFACKTLLDNYIFFYSMILASNKEDVLSWDDFLDAIDKDPSLFKEMNDVVLAEAKKENLFHNEESEKKDAEQKKS